ncbi:copper transport protein ATOX1-like protein [Neoconidiobolus thromboides FSU 785]|nr:copper transport protein ATOX1-like protein [Neoconidiobolus thromboides FSU 785]
MSTYEFTVKMTCSGCSNAVNKALGRLEGVDKVDINMEEQKVTVTTSTATKDQVFEAIKKTGKEVSAL